jgi:hypothetical protein
MMERIPSAIVLLALGVGILFIAWRGHVSGELAVVRFFRLYRPNREDNPRQFYIHLGILIVAGTFYACWGIFIFVGLVEPIPWR